MEIYIIALKELGLDNNFIRLLIENLEFLDFIDLFKGKYVEIQFKYNLDFNKYKNKLSNTVLLSNSILIAKNIIKKNKEKSIKFITIDNKNYPKNLKEIDNAPVVLYYKGRGFFKKHEKSIACVGTRQPSSFSYTAMDALLPKLIEENFTIISGLAEGVDAYSHKLCLDNHGTTIAVLAHGLDMIYPKEHEEIADKILKNNGLLVSEYPIGTKPDKFRFVDRNRIVSGLSKSVIVFETKERSGTMHTVNYAIKQKKNIFCPVPKEATELTVQLHNLIQSKIAYPLLNRSSYDVIVYKSGYKIKKDKNSINKYKSNLLSYTINNINANNTQIYHLLNSELSSKPKKQVNFEIDNELYDNLSSFLKSKNITKKELFNSFLISLLDKKETQE